MEAVWLEGSYENVAADCPHCGKKVIFNRASDLKSFEGISGGELSCLNPACKKPFPVIGYTINAAFEMFVYDCAELYEAKRYSLCIISLAQAWEAFFANFLRLELAYKPYAKDEDQDRLNANLAALYDATQRWTLMPMRNVFLNMLIDPAAVPDVAALVAQAGRLTQNPAAADLQKIDAKVRDYAIALYNSKIHELRNQVAHKRAYRPTKAEVDQYADEARQVLIPLGFHLGVQGDEVNWYAHKFGAAQA